MPSELEHDIEDLEDKPSTITSVKDEADVSKETEQSAAAASSTAEDVSKPAKPDTLSIVRDVVSKEGAAASSAKEATDAGAAAVDPNAQPSEYSDVPFNKHPRFQEVLGKLKTAETDAVRYRNVENFISEQGLAAEEAADLLRIGGLMKTNPVEAWKLMKPKVQQVLIAAGEILPDDLKKRVQANEMAPEVAMEISGNRGALQSTEVRQQFEQRQSATRQVQELGQAIQTEIGSWEAERCTRDPNFEAKMPALQREIAYIHATEGRARDPRGARAQLEKAYNSVSANTPPPPRPKPAIRPVTGGQVSANVQAAKPKSTLEIIQSELAKRAG